MMSGNMLGRLCPLEVHSAASHSTKMRPDPCNCSPDKATTANSNQERKTTANRWSSISIKMY